MTTTIATDAGRLYAVTICYCVAAAAADSKSSASLVTDNVLASLALIARCTTTTGRAAGDGSSSKVNNERFTVLPPCYELTTP